MDLGVAIEIDAGSLKEAQALMQRYISFDPAPLMEALAALGESQTRRRISDEKTAPDGTPWQPNRAGTPILTQTGQHLLASLGYFASSEESIWGASWEFAHIHQEGAIITAKNAPNLHFMVGGKHVSKKAVTIPAREFVGISVENRRDLEELATDFFGRLP